MHEDKIRVLLQQIKENSLSVESALDQFKNLPFEDLGFAMVDHHRQIRTGYPETIFSQGKTIEQITSIAANMLDKNVNIMATRANKEIYQALKSLSEKAVYHELARIVIIRNREVEKTISKILIITAGTSDIPVAEEAAITAEMMGNTVARLFDVGVAGIHRLLSNKSKIDDASVLVVVAGMDGALPSVVAGLTDKPVIAVPTSVGYGASFGGLAALLTMLNSCANGVTVVNIDNGFGAGFSASVINQIAEKAIKS
ncbi:nickel pincer cofactor biosynthesis protein LarB [bacterium]|nr:nickel pincer cofactor biosynthesis protein LarB [bacterium]